MLCIAMAPSFFTPAHADTISLSPSADTTLYQSSTGDISNGIGTHAFFGINSESNERRALIAFDCTSIPAGSTITDVQLTVNLSRLSGSSSIGRLHRMAAAWGESSSDAGEPGGAGAPAQPGDATWLHQRFPSTDWSTPGGDFSPLTSASTTLSLPPPPATFGPGTWASTPALIADVQQWVIDPTTNFGWIIISGSSACRIDTREHLDPLLRPRLTIIFTRPQPVPCPADFNNSGSITLQDLFDFLAAYFSADPQADFNISGSITVQDIFDYLTAYFAGCP